MWLEGPTVQTRLICILRGLEVNMHEGIKRYAFKQTTRSLWITVPTSEPFIFLLACNQADLVCSGWWFHTMDWTLRDVNLLRKKTLSSNQKEHSKKRFMFTIPPKYVLELVLEGVFCAYFSGLICWTVRRSNQGQRSTTEWEWISGSTVRY